MPKMDNRAGDIVLVDSTIFTTLFGGTDSLRKFWRNFALMGTSRRRCHRRWNGSLSLDRGNAQGRWFADAEEWAHQLGVADESIAYDRIVHAEVVGAHAYAVLSATLSFALKGQRSSRRGILIFTFAKQGDEWKVESQAWGRLS